MARYLVTFRAICTVDIDAHDEDEAAEKVIDHDYDMAELELSGEHELTVERFQGTEMPRFIIEYTESTRRKMVVVAASESAARQCWIDREYDDDYEVDDGPSEIIEVVEDTP